MWSGLVLAAPAQERFPDRVLYAGRPESPREAAAYAQWLVEHRSRLFFSDVGVFRWFLPP